MADPGAPEAGSARPADVETLASASDIERARDSESATALARGAEIDRYVVLSQLGAGGMGVVYAAYDPDLDRKVALKLLRSHASDDPGASEGRTRLLREAQALAKLSHPNVVAIHDVGVHEQAVWLAMELVTGQTLRVWAGEHERSWREVLEVVLAAGRGIAAAHAAGLLHRDLKPDNIMVAGDGRVRVMDFGLARAGDPSRRTLEDEHARPDPSTLALNVTQAGAVLGTPAYMAPEQLVGTEVGAAADQFALCVTAWELVFGERPFAGDTLVALMGSVLAGELRTPRRSRRAPGWLRGALVRGLATDPARRWPSVEALLGALARGQTRATIRRTIAASGVLALAVAGVLGARAVDERRRVAACEADGAALTAVWNDAARTELRQGLVATGVSYAEGTAAKATAYLDAQADAWTQARTQACLLARVRGTWDERMLDQSVWCLDERSMELETLIAELTRADATAVQKAVQAAAGLSQVDPCLDERRLTTMPAPAPGDEREQVREVRRELSRAGSLASAGRFEPGLEASREALARAEALGWPPLTAAARGRLGDALDHVGEYPAAEAELTDAFFASSGAGALEVALAAAIDLAFVVGDRQARHAEGRLWARHAEVVLAALGEPEESLRRASLVGAVASVQMRAGAHEEALALFQRVLAIREGLLGADHPHLGSTLNNLASAHAAMGKNDEARALFERALGVWKAAVGADHPEVATALNNLGNVCQATGAYAESRAHYERALAIREAALGRDHPTLASTLSNLATIHRIQGEHAEAKALLERALAILERALGPNHPHVSAVLDNLGNVLVSIGALEDGMKLHERALAINETALGPEHPQVAASLDNLGLDLHALGDDARAGPFFVRALSIREKAQGAEHPSLMTSLMGLADVRKAEGRHAEAKALYERTLANLEKTPSRDPSVVAYPLVGLAEIALLQRRRGEAVALAERALQASEAAPAAGDLPASSRFVLARALWDAPDGHGRDRARARTLATRARDDFRRANARGDRVREVEAWIDQHPAP